MSSELTCYMEPEIEKQASTQGLASRLILGMFSRLFSAALMNCAEGALTQLHLTRAPCETLENGAFYHPIGKVITPTHAQGTNKTFQKTLWEETVKAIEHRVRCRKQLNVCFAKDISLTEGR
jgi:hypothetical protein